VLEGEQLRFSNWQELGGVTLMRTGFIPYECIERVDWGGDAYYRDPHIYCHFDQPRGQPYERIAFCDQRQTSHTEYWLEVATYDEVKILSKKMKIKRYP
jgi:hypothetical protein